MRGSLHQFSLTHTCTHTQEHSTQQTMLTTWLIELYLNDLGCLSDEGDVAGHKRLQTEFHTFLRRPVLKECLEVNRKTVYGLISSHGAVEDLVFFATLMQGEYAMGSLTPFHSTTIRDDHINPLITIVPLIFPRLREGHHPLYSTVPLSGSPQSACGPILRYSRSTRG